MRSTGSSWPARGGNKCPAIRPRSSRGFELRGSGFRFDTSNSKLGGRNFTLETLSPHETLSRPPMHPIAGRLPGHLGDHLPALASQGGPGGAAPSTGCREGGDGTVSTPDGI